MNTLARSPRQLKAFRSRLLLWFRKRKRDLPWRRTRDPYRIWLSEVMLQQTRVAAAVPYYLRFVARFPNVRRLAAARPESVLRYWAGLGYYSRARNLHRAAKQIVALHAARFPREHAAALALPGVGRYTAAAVLSIAYGQPLAVLDGNVARVLARLGAVRGELRAPTVQRRLQQDAGALLSPSAPGDWNQAMMELGATICTPKSPRCGDCPVARWCRARKLGLTAEVPAVGRKPQAVQIRLAAAVLLEPSGRTLLVRPAGGEAALFSRMWQFPAVAIASKRAGTREPALQLRKYLREGFGAGVDGPMTALKAARHTVTFREISLEPYLVRVSRLPIIEGARTPFLEDIARLPVSAATRKIAGAALRAP